MLYGVRIHLLVDFCSGRFLQKDSKLKSWSDMSVHQKAQEKTSQALRDGAPDNERRLRMNQVTSTTAYTAVKLVNKLVSIWGFTRLTY